MSNPQVVRNWAQPAGWALVVAGLLGIVGLFLPLYSGSSTVDDAGELIDSYSLQGTVDVHVGFDTLFVGNLPIVAIIPLTLIAILALGVATLIDRGRVVEYLRLSAVVALIAVIIGFVTLANPPGQDVSFVPKELGIKITVSDAGGIYGPGAGLIIDITALSLATVVAVAAYVVVARPWESKAAKAAVTLAKV